MRKAQLYQSSRNDSKSLEEFSVTLMIGGDHMQCTNLVLGVSVALLSCVLVIKGSLWSL